MDAEAAAALDESAELLVKRFGGRLRDVRAVREGGSLVVMVVVDDLAEREEHRLYNVAAGLSRRHGVTVFFAPYSTHDFARRRPLPFEVYMMEEGESALAGGADSNEEEGA